MRKYLLATVLTLCAASTAEAGGYLTNTNQSVAFLRNPARDGYIAIDGAYSNPAGVGFMTTGWHFGFDLQSAYQTRTPTSYFPSFAYGTVNGTQNNVTGVKEFKGKAKAPVIPSFDLARVGEKWFATFHFGITGGGGKCSFDNGLGSFESQVSVLPSVINILSPGMATGYTMDTYMQGRQYYFGGQFGVGYRILPNLNVSVGGRVVYADCNYYGYVRNIGVNIHTAAGVQNVPVGKFFESQGLTDFAALAEDRELNCDQTGWGFTPILGIDYKVNDKINLAAKYEFKTRLRLKNRAGVNTSGLEEYDDGRKIAADIPAILTLGVEYSALSNLRLSGGFHYYFDKQATQWNHKENNLANGGWEVLAGMEYDINKRWTVSAGWQTTNYGLGENSAFLSDMSFVTNSNSIGVGARFRLRKKVALNVAYFKTIYKHYKKNMSDYDNLSKKFSSQVATLTAALTADAATQAAILQNASATSEQKLAAKSRLQTIQAERAVKDQVLAGMPNASFAGYDKFHRTNDVFGLGLEIDF